MCLPIVRECVQVSHAAGVHRIVSGACGRRKSGGGVIQRAQEGNGE